MSGSDVHPKKHVFGWNFLIKPPHTSILGLIAYMVRSGAKLFRTKILLNFASKADGNQGGPNLKDPLQVPNGPMMRINKNY